MAKESLSLLFVLIATACALKCYNQAILKCGEHEAQYDSTCAEIEKQTTDMGSTTCGDGFDKCASGEMTYSLAGLEITVKFASCSTGDTGCLENVEGTINDQLESSPAVPSLPGLTRAAKDFCMCEEDLCNSAILNDRSIIVILLSALLALFI